MDLVKFQDIHIFTFIPIFGTYTVPQLVGGKDSYMLGNIIVDQVQKVRNWPLASAFSMIITIVSMAGVLLMLGSGSKQANLNKVSNKEDSSVAPVISKTAASAASTESAANANDGGSK